MWIDNKKSDLINFIIIPFFILALFIASIYSGYFNLSYILIGVISFELFHIYFTLPLLKYHKHFIYVYLFSFIFIISFLYFQIPYLWSFLSYFTFFHLFKQNYGMLVLYSKKQNSELGKKHIKKLFYFLIILPFIMFHFYPNINEKLNIFSNIHGANFFFNHGNIAIYSFLQIIYIISIFTWLILEIKYYSKDQWFRFLLFFFIFAIHFISLINPLYLFALYPINIIHHVITYYFMTKKYYDELNLYKKVIFNKRNLILFFILIITLVYNSLELISSEARSYLNNELSAKQIILITLYMTPILSHFIIDSFIWRKNSEYFSKIFYKK
jgi:hypothetical protein